MGDLRTRKVKSGAKRMAELLTSAQMRAIEAAAIAAGAVTGLELMERAGQGVVEAVFAEWPDLGPELAPAAGGDRGAGPSNSPEYLGQNEGGHRAVVLCGPGNNGGDGFVVARLLAGLGWAVEVFLYGEAGKLPPDAKANYELWREFGEVAELDEKVAIDTIDAEFERYALVVDAIFGTGLSRPFSVFPRLPRALRSFRDSAEPDCLPKVIAVDVPSGLCADSGRWLGEEDGDENPGGANLTVTFHAAKRGHVLAAGPGCCGRLRIVDIGLGSTFQRRNRRALARLHGVAEAEVEMAARPLTGELSFDVSWPMVDPASVAKAQGHKFAHGHALILAGASGKGGAGRLAGRGALRIGAGLVTLAPTPGAAQENAARLEAIMLAPVGDGATLARILEDARLNALLLGPGLGLERARDLVPVALEARRATVLDADALTAFSGDPAALFATLHEDCVLTPHAGEFARLFPDIAEKLAKPATRGPAYSKVDATREAAKRAGCTILFKGPDTVIADPSSCCKVNSAAYERAAPWLATAGSGDVLAGFITGLLARGFPPQAAAETAAWLHVEAARSFGPGLIAEDLPEELPKTYRSLGL